MPSWFGRGKSLQLAVTACCLTAFVLFGYDQGVFGGILQNEDWLTLFNHPSDSLTGIIVSCYNLGCLTGCIINFFTGEILGRRKTIWFAMGFVLVGAALQTSAYSVPHLIVGRVITGFGTGLKSSTVPVYQSELCNRKMRGRLVSAEVMFVGIGIVIAYWFDFGMAYAGGPIAWRLPIAFQIVFALFVIALVFGLPESPRWLFNHGQKEEALRTLCEVHDKDPTDPDIITEMEVIEQAIAMDRENIHNRSLISIFKKDTIRTRYRVFLAWGIQFMNQAGGINLIVYYIPSVLVKNVGTTAHTALILGGCINIMFVVGAILPTLALDRLGRRPTMMWGSLGLGICMVLVAALLSQATKPGIGHACASASMAFFFLFMLFYGASASSVPWVYVPEILPLSARTQGTAIGISSNWLWNFTVVMITPVIINRLDWKAYMIFAATNLLFVPAIYFFYPETSNLGLEDIDYIFTKGVNPVKAARELQKQVNRTDARRPSVVSTASMPGARQQTEEGKVSVENIEVVGK